MNKVISIQQVNNMWKANSLDEIKVGVISHAVTLVLTRDSDQSRISRTKLSNYRDINDTSNKFEELCKALLDSNTYLQEPSKDILPGVLVSNKTTKRDDRTKFDNKNDFYPFGMDLVTYYNFVNGCRDILERIEPGCFFEFMLNISHPILFCMKFLRSLNDWIDRKLVEAEAKLNGKS